LLLKGEPLAGRGANLATQEFIKKLWIFSLQTSALACTFCSGTYLGVQEVDVSDVVCPLLRFFHFVPCIPLFCMGALVYL
jgi:hypothetical protein